MSIKGPSSVFALAAIVTLAVEMPVRLSAKDADNPQKTESVAPPAAITSSRTGASLEGADGAVTAPIAIAVSPQEKSPGSSLQPRWIPQPADLATMQRASQLIGLAVRDRDNDKLGKIDDLLVELPSGKVVCALLAPASGSDHALIPIPAATFISADTTKAVFDAAKTTLKNAPRLPDTPAVMAKSAADSHIYFNMQPAWTASPNSQTIIRASQMTGMQLRNKAHEDLGNLRDLMVNLPKAELVFAVISLDGTDQSLYAAPPMLMSADPAKPALVLDAAKSKAGEAAHSGQRVWEQMTDPAWAVATYRFFDSEAAIAVTPSAVADATRENVRAKIEPAPAATPRPAAPTGLAVIPNPAPDPAPPVNKAAGLPDAEITKQIVTAIIRADMDNVYITKKYKVVTIDGHVTLEGTVKNQKQRDEIRKAAESIVGVGNVDNQLLTR